jgi:hypothetical protein
LALAATFGLTMTTTRNNLPHAISKGESDQQRNSKGKSVHERNHVCIAAIKTTKESALQRKSLVKFKSSGLFRSWNSICRGKVEPAGAKRQAMVIQWSDYGHLHE